MLLRVSAMINMTLLSGLQNPDARPSEVRNEARQ